jgi:hypothetical protein
VTLREEPAVLESLEFEAWRAGRTLSDEIRHALREHLRREERPLNAEDRYRTAHHEAGHRLPVLHG